MTRIALNRASLGTAAAACLLVLFLGFSSLRLADRRAAYEGAVQSLQEAASLVDQMKLLRAKPDKAALQSRSDRTLAEQIERAAVAAGIAREQIARIEPQAPRRAADADYLEHSTILQLDSVPLKQFAAALTSLRLGSQGLSDLKVSTLRIAAPYQAGDASSDERWNIELTLTYFVYSPKTSPARKS